MENGETIEQGAAREAWEEARLTLDQQRLYTIFSLPYINQVYVFYLARVAKLDFGPGPESTEVALFDLDQIPWDDLAFPVVTVALKDYLADLETGQFPVRNQMMDKDRKRVDLTFTG
jgi:ADP-ribose pyrophosphatase YjhB (NUDIX family)